MDGTARARGKRDPLVLACVGVALLLAIIALAARLARVSGPSGAGEAVLAGIVVALGVGTLVAWRRGRARDGADAPRFGVQYSYEWYPDRPRRLLDLGPGLDRVIGPINVERVRERFDVLFDLIHPDDAEAIRAEAKRGMDEDRVVEVELRARGDDGRYRWIRSIGRPEAIGDGGWRWQVVLLDIDQYKRSERILRLIAERTSTATGEAFFPALAGTISETLDVRHVLVFEHLDRPATRARTLAFWSGRGIRGNVEIAIAGTPCEGPARGEAAFFPARETHPFVQAPEFEWMKAKSYYERPLRDSAGALIGHIALLDDEPMPAGLDEVPALSIFAARAAAELERVRSEQALRDSMAVIGSVFESMPDGVLVLDAGGRVVMCNDVVRGFSDRDIIGESAVELTRNVTTYGPDGRTPAATTDWAMSRALRGEDVDDCVTRVVLHEQDDRAVWFSSTARPIRDAEGVVTGAVAVFRDVTERLRTDRALRQSEAHLRTLVEHAPEAILIFDVEANRFDDCNPNATRLFRMDRGRLLTIGPVELSAAVQPDGRPSDEAARAAIAATLAGRTPVFEWSFELPGRDPFPCEVRLVHLPDDERVLIRASVTDITARKQAERELRSRQEQERLLFRELDHRVRNNLAALLSLIDLTRQGASDTPAFAMAIRSRIETMAHVHDMLAQGQWRSVRFDTLLGRLRPPEARGRINVDGVRVDVPPRQVTAVAMVVHELLVNSAKHGALGAEGGEVDIAWTVDAGEGGARRLVVDWTERGGPEITDASRRGVGTGLIEGLTRAELRGALVLDYPPDGARHRIEMVLDVIGEPEPMLTR